MTSKYFLGIDVSTTSVKALLMDAAGKAVHLASTEQDFRTPRPLWTEQDPDTWWQNTRSSIRKVIREAGIDAGEIQAAGLTGQMHGLVLLDKEGKVLRPAILWNDQRTGEQCREIEERVGRERLIRLTGNAALPGFTAPKLLWVAENEPDVYAKTAHVLLPKDYVRYCLTGGFASDCSDAAGTVLLDIRTRNWSSEVCGRLGVPLEWLPRVHEGPAITGEITAAAAEATGLKKGIPVAAGGGDQAAQAVGVGAVEDGILALTLGTSGILFAPTTAPLEGTGGSLHIFCHAVPQMWHAMGVTLSAGGSLKWFRDVFAPGTGYDELLGPVETTAPGAEGLLFLPYLTGERTPHADPLARGAFVGLTLRHGMGHLVRAVLEGVGYGLRDSLELIRAAGSLKVEQFRASGGGTRNAAWRQILADILGQEVLGVDVVEGAAFGAAILAGVSTGNWVTVKEACRSCIRTTSRTTPNREVMEYYDRAYKVYQGLYPGLADTFRSEASL
jgi:xylulokinase